jgi:tRNA pseudouridine38-40 synthase
MKKRTEKLIEDIKSSQFRYASRTDKKVSALGNVIAFNSESNEKDIKNKILIQFKEIIIYGYSKVPIDFFPRYAKQRHYRYFLEIKSLDDEKILNAVKIFEGEHNFSNFARLETNKNPIRTIDCINSFKINDYLVIDFHAQTFLWNQIRRIIAALIKLGKNKITIKQIKDGLENPNKKIDFGVAPAKPLILMDIIYDFHFNIDKKLYSIAEELILPF